MLPVHEWQIDLGPYSGQAGEIKVLSATPQVPYYVENIFATDDSPSPGNGTRLAKLIVGNQLQRPALSSTLSAIFGVDKLRTGKNRGLPGGGNDEGMLHWDMCPAGSTISVEVSFVVACQFDMTFFGKAVG